MTYHQANHTTARSTVPPALILASLNAYNLWNEHWEHWSHMPPLEERVEYPYQNIRTRNYQWGDGDKVCFTPPFDPPLTPLFLQTRLTNMYL